MTSKRHKPSTCHCHPAQPITGFCASCLRERLEGIESSSSPHHDYPNKGNNNNGLKHCPQLRRTKSCSGRHHPAASEPHRRSCEVGVKNTLSDLFNIDDEGKGLKGRLDFKVRDVGLEIREEELDEADGKRVTKNVIDEGQSDEIFEEEALTVKEFIDLEWHSWKSNTGRDFKDIAGSLWDATSALAKRLKKWRRKQKSAKNGDDKGHGALMDLKGVKRSMRGLSETRSKVSEQGLGRRSCDTDPRLSIDACRMSVDDSRFSFDEPRASWDGYLIGKACHPRLMPLVSVVEDVNSPPEACENRASIELKEPSTNGEEQCPGGTAQTIDYYSNLSWQRRRSFDSSSSHRKHAISEADELKLISNSKVSPATTELFYGAKLLITEKELMEMNYGSVGNVHSGYVDTHARETSDIVVGTCQKGSKKLQKWRGVLNMLGMWPQKAEDGVIENIADELPGESRATNGEATTLSLQHIRSCSVSCRNSHSVAELCKNLRSIEAKEISVKEQKDLMLHRDRSAKYSPNNLDNGLSRFYLTPSRSYRRSKSGKSWLKALYPTGKNVL